MECTVVKRSSLPTAQRALKKMAAGASPVEFQIVDNGDLTYTVNAIDAAGNAFAIDPTLATLTATSDNPAVLTADAPTGFTGAVHVPVPAPVVGAKCNITLVATWGAGTPGPFTFTWAFSIGAGGATGIVPVPGPVTVH